MRYSITCVRIISALLGGRQVSLYVMLSTSINLSWNCPHHNYVYIYVYDCTVNVAAFIQEILYYLLSCQSMLNCLRSFLKLTHFNGPATRETMSRFTSPLLPPNLDPDTLTLRWNIYDNLLFVSCRVCDAEMWYGVCEVSLMEYIWFSDRQQGKWGACLASTIICR